MGPKQKAIHRRTAVVTLTGLLLSPGGLLGTEAAPHLRAAPGQSAAAPAAKPASPTQPAAKPAAAPAPAPPTMDGEWPRRFTTASGAAFSVYQPQVASWDKQSHMVFYSAASYSAKAGDKPALGTIKAEASTKVSVTERLVDFSILKITESNFPTLAKPQIQDIVAELTKGIPQYERVIALDRVLASVDKSQILPRNVEGVKADPPVVFFSKTPAVIVNIDGDPIWSPVTGTDLKFAINTNWDLFELSTTKTFYLRNDATWLKASSLDGAWTPAGTLPDSFKKIPADENWTDVRAALPGKPLASNAMPKVFVSTKPAELILLKGEPSYLLVQGTSLLWVNNTDSDVFRNGKTGPVYYLVAGRWFSAPDFTGPWTFATLNLPPDFQKIPLEHDRSRVLASVPGTDQAAEAVLLASIPQTARVEKKSVKAPDVSYDGEPKFEAIDKTTVSRAVNTDKDIIKVGDLYYMCFQGVWFMAKAAAGPWEVTGSVPKQIYEIPVSSPSHSVTYVTVEDDSNDWVTFASAAAYTGVMVAWGCAVWGSGYYYPPYIGYGGLYPIYRPFYPTYGYSAWYNPWTGSYGRGAAVYGPYGGAGVAARYNPSTGRYSRGAAAWGPYGGAAVGGGYNARTGTYSRGAVAAGPYGARGAAEAYNPRTGAYGATRQGSGVYGSWGQTGVQRGDDWATTSRVTNRATGTTTRVSEGSGGGSMVSRNTPGPGGSFVGQSGSGDVYAGRDGNVYRKQGDSWQKYDNGGWNNTQQPTPQQRQAAQDRASQAGAQARDRAAGSGIDSATAGQLNRDSAARRDGAQRTRDAGSMRSGGGSGARAGSYRPSGGGARARPSGGGRRR
jgi:hypothetical protein